MIFNQKIQITAAILWMAAVPFFANAQGEVQNALSQFWKVNGNSGISAGSNFIGTINNASFRVRTLNLERMVVDSTGNVGIGTTTPSTRLHVSGDFRLVNGSQANNFVLMSDVNGLSTWKPADSVLANATTKAWNTVGNAGTNATTNFIGTTDAVDFVVKTNGSASNFERLRVIGSGATPGQIVQNNRGILAGDVFSVYANNTTNGTTNSIYNSIGNFAINGYAPSNGFGVYGESYTAGVTANGFGVYGASISTAGSIGSGIVGDLVASTTLASNFSTGVWGLNNSNPAGTGATAAQAIGVEGDANGTPGTGYTIGVLGFNAATSGFADGVDGLGQSPNGYGVYGLNVSATASFGHGIQGQTLAFGGAAGVRGFNSAASIGNGQSGYGVRGSCNVTPTGSGFATGVRGDCSAATGSTYGIFGQVASATGFGSYGFNSNASGTGSFAIGNNVTGTYLVAGSGLAAAGSALGTLSLGTTAATGVGVLGVGNNLTGSLILPSRGAGVTGVGAQYGVVGFATSTVVTDPNSNSVSNGANASSGGYFEVQNAGGTAQTWAYVAVREVAGAGGLRKIIGPGTVNTIVKDMSDNLVALSCPETPENLFQDYGQGRLVKGKAHVDLDPIFAKNILVDATHPLRVLVQVEGECHGVYVTNKTQHGFDVVELDCGTSKVPFTYSVTANRADEVNPDGSISKYSIERFPKALGPQSSTRMDAAQVSKYPAAAMSEEPREISNTLIQGRKQPDRKGNH